MNRVGGSSGALYGTLFLRLSAVLQDVPVPDAPALALAFAQGTESVMQRGKAQPGDKTMVDALVPAVAALQAHASGSTPEAALHHAAQAARQGAEATRTLIARQGRARFTGERSLGHVDAGAVSVALLFETLALAWKDVDDAKA
jgi:dihydroxyacetone kinase-like protein